MEWPLKWCTSTLPWHTSWSRALQLSRAANPESFFIYLVTAWRACLTVFLQLFWSTWPSQWSGCHFVCEGESQTNSDGERRRVKIHRGSVWLWYFCGSPRAAELSWALAKALNCGEGKINRRERWQVATSETRTDWKDLRPHPKWCLMV